MKIGILTFLFSKNYGAFLQAYGLKKTIEFMGHEVEFINYIPKSRRTSKFKGWGLLSGRKMPEIIKKRLLFDSFRYRNLPSTKPCYTKDDLKNIEKGFDAIIVGSDQVWNGHLNTVFEDAYFLNFSDRKGCRKITYAACFGDSNQPEFTIKSAGELIEKFDYLSVRNQMSADIVSRISKKDAEIVLDPTLIYDFKDIIKEKVSKKKYIAAYFLPHNKIEIGRKVVKTVKDILQLPVISFSDDMIFDNQDKLIKSAGPIEWLQIIGGADFICTDSFHGTVFSVKFRKPFISWSQDSVEGFRGPERILDFLNTCEMGNRLIYNADDDLINFLISSKLDYSSTFSLLQPKIKKSKDFIRRALL